MLNKTADVDRRIQAAYAAFGDTIIYWIPDYSILLKDKIMLYNAYVLPHFTYCIGSLPLTNQLVSNSKNFIEDNSDI
jgi:hypothetical protein